MTDILMMMMVLGTGGDVLVVDADSKLTRVDEMEVVPCPEKH